MPLVNRTFDQLIDFTRTSAATFVNSSGNIASTPQSRNLLTFTEEFANAAWTKTNTTITANSTAAPNGINTADTAATTSTNDGIARAVTGLTANATHTLSFYVKNGTATWLRLVMFETAASTNRFSGWVNLATGAAGTASNGGTGSGSALSVTNVGNGWYRVALSGAVNNSATACTVQISTAASDTSTTGVSGVSFFIWGAQLEQASAATDYTRNYGGLYPPRFDYDPVTLAPKGLLIEEQRTNLLVRSEEFDNASWTKTAATVTADAAVSPDGTSNADKLVEDTSTGNHYIRQLVTTVTSTTYTASVYLKAAGRNARLFVYQNVSPFATIGSVTVDLSNGAVLSGSGTVASVGNGWYRVSVSGAAVDTATRVLVDLAQGTTLSYTGDGTSGIFIWGAQFEAGAFATSYIPTVASQVTRTADVAAINAPNFASWYNQSEGTLLVEWDSSTATSLAVANLSDGTTSNRITVQNDNTFQGAVLAGGAVQASLDGGTLGTINKVAFAFKANDFALSLGGAAAVTDASGTNPTVDRLILGANGAGSASFLNGRLRSLRYYPVRLTNAQLQALTA